MKCVLPQMTESNRVCVFLIQYKFNFFLSMDKILIHCQRGRSSVRFRESEIKISDVVTYGSTLSLLLDLQQDVNKEQPSNCQTILAYCVGRLA